MCFFYTVPLLLPWILKNKINPTRQPLNFWLPVTGPRGKRQQNRSSVSLSAWGVFGTSTASLWCWIVFWLQTQIPMLLWEKLDCGMFEWILIRWETTPGAKFLQHESWCACCGAVPSVRVLPDNDYSAWRSAKEGCEFLALFTEVTISSSLSKSSSIIKKKKKKNLPFGKC